MKKQCHHSHLAMYARENCHQKYNLINCQSSYAREKYQEKLSFLIDLVMVPNDTKSTPEEVQTFNEAWNHPNEDSPKKGQEAISKHVANMNKQQVF